MTEFFISQNETKYFNVCGYNIAVNVINNTVNISKINDTSNLSIENITSEYLIIIYDNKKDLEYHIVKNLFVNGLYVKIVENSCGCCMVIDGYTIEF